MLTQVHLPKLVWFAQGIFPVQATPFHAEFSFSPFSAFVALTDPVTTPLD
jgi:hypothetical protein